MIRLDLVSGFEKIVWEVAASGGLCLGRGGRSVAVLKLEMVWGIAFLPTRVLSVADSDPLSRLSPAG